MNHSYVIKVGFIQSERVLNVHTQYYGIVGRRLQLVRKVVNCHTILYRCDDAMCSKIAGLTL